MFLSGIEDDDLDADEGSPLEIVLITAVVPVMSFLMYVVLDSSLESRKKHFVHAHSVNMFTVLIATLFNDYINLVSFLVFVGAVVIVAYFIRSIYASDHQKTAVKTSWFRSLCVTCAKFQDKEIDVQSNSLPFLTAYRGTILLGTVISILAVDFWIYPVRFSKTESFGWSLMDIGVGCFICIHGMCSAQARGKQTGSFWKEVKSSVPLLVLGFARLCAVTATGYHQNVLEYGIHWNFFFTLGLTKVLCCILYQIIPSASSIYFTMLLGMLHQHALSSHGLTSFILNEDRDGFMKANKEGILSIPGFMFIYLVCVELGKHFNKPRCKMKDYTYLLGELMVMAVCGWHCTMILHDGIQPVSRRMANIPYCVWILTLTCILIAVHLIEFICLIVYQMHIDHRNGILSQKVTCPKMCLWEALNYNGLLHFLAGNVLTGIVNITINTLDASVGISYLVLLSYSSILCGISVMMKERCIRVKI